MKFTCHKFILSFVMVFAGIGFVYSQPPDPFGRDRDSHREEEAKVVKDMLARQQSERDKKEHEELLKRADAEMELSNDLDKAFKHSPMLSSTDEKKLAELEKVVKKIRDDLGGDDDEQDEDAAEIRPKDVKDAFLALHKSTIQLVEEVKKTTRFSISAAAIQSSNTVLRLVRFLRLRN